MLLKSRTISLCCLLGMLVVAVPGWAAEKPQLFILDTGVAGSNFPDAWTKSQVSDHLSFATSVALMRRFSNCARSLSNADVRLMIGQEKMKAMFGADDSSTLAEIGSALGRQGLLVRSSASFSVGSGWAMEVVLLNIVKSTREGSSSATADSRGLYQLADKAVDGLPDLCAPMWGGKVSVQYAETLKSETRDESSDVKFFNSTELKLGVESSVYPLALAGDTQQVSAEHKVSGAFKSTAHRISQALCGGGERGGPERVVPDGYRESSYASSEFGPVLGDGENDTAGPSFGLQIDPQRGTYTLELLVPSVRYAVSTQARHVLEECGKASTDVPPAIPSEQSWAGTRISVERGFKKGQTSISGGDSHAEASPGRDDAKTSTAYQWDLRAKPYIEYLMKKR